MSSLTYPAHVRAARPSEAGLLSDIALRSKGHWGYSPEILQRFRGELTITPGDIVSGVVLVAEDRGRVLGFARVVQRGEHEAELSDLFVAPDSIGGGVGALLWTAALETARGCGKRTIRIESDPHAEGFYLAMGARRVGEAPSGSIPGRMLPLLEMDLAGRNAGSAGPGSIEA